ncbi:MAG: hypothetical protein J6L88_08115 [Clostridia bacterium]|nr:hypothetical protein [Clostridia bacterium]
MNTSLKGLLLVLVLMLVMTCVIPYIYAEVTAEAIALDSMTTVRENAQSSNAHVWMAFVMAMIASFSVLLAKRYDGANAVT